MQFFQACIDSFVQKEWRRWSNNNNKLQKTQQQQCPRMRGL